MALVGLHFSGFFKDRLLTGKMSGTILKDKWSIPVGEKLFVYLAPENAETSTQDEKIGIAEIASCKEMMVSELSDKEAKACTYEDAESLREGVKHWHKCTDSDTVTFIEFIFTKYK